MCESEIVFFSSRDIFDAMFMVKHEADEVIIQQGIYFPNHLGCDVIMMSFVQGTKETISTSSTLGKSR